MDSSWAHNIVCNNLRLVADERLGDAVGLVLGITVGETIGMMLDLLDRPLGDALGLVLGLIIRTTVGKKAQSASHSARPSAMTSG